MTVLVENNLPIDPYAQSIGGSIRKKANETLATKIKEKVEKALQPVSTDMKSENASLTIILDKELTYRITASEELRNKMIQLLQNDNVFLNRDADTMKPIEDERFLKSDKDDEYIKPRK